MRLRARERRLQRARVGGIGESADRFVREGGEALERRGHGDTFQGDGRYMGFRAGAAFLRRERRTP